MRVIPGAYDRISTTVENDGVASHVANVNSHEFPHGLSIPYPDILIIAGGKDSGITFRKRDVVHDGVMGGEKHFCPVQTAQPGVVNLVRSGSHENILTIYEDGRHNPSDTHLWPAFLKEFRGPEFPPFEVILLSTDDDEATLGHFPVSGSDDKVSGLQDFERRHAPFVQVTVSDPSLAF